MPDAREPRDLDAAALARTVRRLALAPAAPWLHTEVARRMAERLAVVKRTPQTVIDWWSHVGGGQALLRLAYPGARLVAVEPPERLAAEASAAAGAGRRWTMRWRRAPAPPIGEPAVPAAGAELLWANMMLHRVSDPEAVLQRWHAALAVDGFLMFSTLGPGSLAGLRAIYDGQGWPAPHAPFVDMHDLGDALVGAGFADPVMDQETLTLTWPSAETLLAELRSLGGNAAPGRTAGLRTPRWRRRLEHGLQALAGPDGRLRLGFEIVYGHAFKAAPRVPVTGRTELSLQAMRTMVRGRRP
jgi:malonyl-CoA O-methyltransferase